MAGPYQEADVVVVGGGVIGSAVAYYLARVGQRVVLLEAGGPLGAGTSVASMGAVNLLTKKPDDYLRLAMASAAMFSSLEDELGSTFEYERNGGLLVAQNEREAEFVLELAKQQRQAGVPVESLTAAQARRREPALADGLCGASFSPTEGLVNPLLLVQAFQRAAQMQGAVIRHRSPVQAVHRGGNSGLIATTSDGQVRARWLVNAAGPQAPALGRFLGLEHPILPVRGQVLVTEAVPRPLQGIVVSACYVMAKHRPDLAASSPLPPGLVCRPTASGNLMVGVTLEPGASAPSATAPGIGAIAQLLHGLLPAFAGLSIIRAFAGVRPTSETGYPLVQTYAERPGYLLAGGHAGDGVALAPLTGQYVAELISGRQLLPPQVRRLFAQLPADVRMVRPAEEQTIPSGRLEGEGYSGQRR